jgi:hypothetical protein
MRTVAEARCVHHGSDSGTTANSAAVLLPCIGVEIVAVRTRAAAESPEDSIRRVFHELADHVGYGRYKTVGFPLFILARHGLAHGFYPNDVEIANGPKASLKLHFWVDAETHRSVCVDELGPTAASKHLTRHELASGHRVLLEVSVQHFYRDVAAYLRAFIGRLASEPALQQLASARDEEQLRWATERAASSPSSHDLMNLGI